MSRSLGEFELLLLFTVLRLGDDAYGAAVARDIEQRTGREVAQGAVYTGLDRLEARALLRSHMGEPQGGRGGRRRRYFALEASGAVALSRSLGAIESAADGLREVLSERLEGESL